MNVTYALKPIGTVRVAKDGFRLLIDREYREALAGLEGFSHVQTVYWFHLNDSDEARSCRVSKRPYKKGPEKLGIFATRSPFRPNPIAVTPSRILEMDEAEGTIRVDYIDAEDGTPILDLKPYHPCSDRVRDAEVPKWCAHWPKCLEDNATFDWGAEFNF